MAILYLDPTGAGSPFQWFGSYTNIDDGVRQPTVPNSVNSDTLYIDAFTEGDKATLTYDDPTTAGTITAISVWVYTPNGEGQTELKVNGTSLGNRSKDTTVSNWDGFDYTGLSIALSGASFITIHSCGSEEDDEIHAVYIEITYTPSAAPGVVYPRHILADNIIMPPWLGVRN